MPEVWMTAGFVKNFFRRNLLRRKKGGFAMEKNRNPEKNTVNRQYKSSIFTMLFSEKEQLLALYNAVNGTSYEDPGLLEINTLENAIYMAVKNDVSFLIDIRLHLYEHQSSWNPNMPLRDLFYVSDLYSEITRDANLFGSKPRFLVFYNGTQEHSDRVLLRLSEMYEKPETSPALELEVQVLNINSGHNEQLLDACRPLREYAAYTARVRRYANMEGLSLKEAVERAVTECIQEGILEEFLRKNRAEAMKVSIYEYDAEKHIRMEREDAFQDGREDMLMSQIEKKLARGESSAQIARELEQEERVVRELIEKLRKSE